MTDASTNPIASPQAPPTIRHPRAATLVGGCACGQVRYRAKGRADRCYACHCTECQTRSGSAFALLLPVAETHFACEGDVLAVEQTEAGGVAARLYACPRCLTRLFTRNPLWPGLVILRVGTLEETAAVAPAFHIWTRSQQPWLALSDGRPAFETQPTDPAEWRRLLG